MKVYFAFDPVRYFFTKYFQLISPNFSGHTTRDGLKFPLGAIWDTGLSWTTYFLYVDLI